MRKFYFLLLTLSIQLSCKEKSQIEFEINNFQKECNKILTKVIVHDIFSPPVGSRIYAYCNLAFFEALRFKDTTRKSLINKLNGFKKLEIISQKKINYNASSVIAFFLTAKALVFSKDSIDQKISYYTTFFKNHLDKETFDNSIYLANSVSKIILDRATNDNYKITRGLPKFSVYTNTNWQQTPPDYFDAIEPNWKLIKTLFLDSASQFKPKSPPIYSINKGSEFYKEMLSVYHKSMQLTQEEKDVASFWDDNPYITNHKGHFTFATKKVTPVGHWMSIISIINTNCSDVETSYLYACVSVVIFDSFISCWEEKYDSKRIRPITGIRNTLDEEWNSFLQTPPFPEYTSGHSVISTAAAATIEFIIDRRTPFIDSTEFEYIGAVRSFSNVSEAAKEAGMSRYFGGIHFMSAITQGKKQGEEIGNFFKSKIHNK
jgi:hypothetical protein